MSAPVTTGFRPNLKPGIDFRRREYRRETFLAFYDFHLRHRAHPGAVYYVLPALAEHYEWDAEQRAWAAFLNGNTQNPVTTLRLMQIGSRPEHAGAVLTYWRNNWKELAWDTDRRYHKANLDDAVQGYLLLVEGAQTDYWRRAADGGWRTTWKAANAVPTMGRLSTWSYVEYLRILGVADIEDAPTLMLEDMSGSKSHRNGLALVLGRDDIMWWDRNPEFKGRYTADDMIELSRGGEALLHEARKRIGHPDVSYLTLESALCTYKSWHRPNRRYPNVYNDMLHDRLKWAEKRHGEQFNVIWQARADNLPKELRLEDNPADPGCTPAKQNWYLETGEPPLLDLEWPDIFGGSFTAAVAEERWGKCR